MNKYKFEIYRDKKKEFRWRLKARNGRIIGDSAESYKKRASAEKIISKFLQAVCMDSYGAIWTEK
jgi:uncharacterized protein YegP (UPF0339 family)